MASSGYPSIRRSTGPALHISDEASPDQGASNDYRYGHILLEDQSRVSKNNQEVERRRLQSLGEHDDYQDKRHRYLQSNL